MASIDLGDRELQLGLDVDHDQRGAVVVRLEAALAHLAERDREQPVGDVPVVGHALLERYVEQRLDHAAPAADQPDRVAVARPRRAPDDRPRLVPLERLDGFPGRGRGGHGGSLDVGRTGVLRRSQSDLLNHRPADHRWLRKLRSKHLETPDPTAHRPPYWYGQLRSKRLETPDPTAQPIRSWNFVATQPRSTTFP